MIECREEKGPETTSRRRRFRQVVSCQEPLEKLLGQILSFFDRVAPAAYGRKQWQPINLAKRGKGVVAFRRLALGGCEHQTPVSRTGQRAGLHLIRSSGMMRR